MRDDARFDVAVIGGGPAGAATAIALARGGVSVALIEAGHQGGDKPGESLPPSARPLLERLDVWDGFLRDGPLPCYANRSSWGGDGRLTERDFINDPYGHGWHIDRRRFEAMLLDGAVEAGAAVVRGDRVVGESRVGEGWWRLDLAGPSGCSQVVAKVAVDASGRAAAFARRRGARRRRVDRLAAAVGFLASDLGEMRDTATLVEAARDGWWYSAPLPGGRLAVAFFADPDLDAARRARTAEGWTDLLVESVHTRERVEGHGFRLCGAPWAVAAGSGRLDRICGEGWLAVGDAAATFDPLSSHGIGAALDGGLRAGAAISACLQGDASALSMYEEQVVDAYGRYLRTWRAYYADERRWPERAFWRRRHDARIQVGTPLMSHAGGMSAGVLR